MREAIVPEGREMRRDYGILGCALCFLVAGGCASTTYSAFGPEIEAKVEAALESANGREAALSTAPAAYWMPGTGLAAERNALLAALREAPYQSHIYSSGVPRDAEVVLANDNRVVAWMRPEVFEVACPTGTLHVERMLTSPRDAQPGFRLSIVQGNHAQYAGVKTGARIEQAWRRLAGAASRSAHRMVWVGMDRPLERLRDLEVDYRGYNPQLSWTWSH